LLPGRTSIIWRLLVNGDFVANPDFVVKLDIMSNPYVVVQNNDVEHFYGIVLSSPLWPGTTLFDSVGEVNVVAWRNVPADVAVTNQTKPACSRAMDRPVYGLRSTLGDAQANVWT
jgi:hypothetical protein